MSTNVNRESSANVDQIVKILRRPDSVRTHLAVIFSLQETRSWDVENLSLPGFDFYGRKLGLTTLVASDFI